MVRGTHNLKRYVQAALLPRMINGRDAPPMPPEGHRSHRNNLAVRPETWRRLENIYSLDNFDFENVVSSCKCQFSRIDMFFPFEPLRMDDMDEDNGDTLSIPCPGTNFDITYREERKPSNLQRIAPWVDNLALMTVQRIMHLLYPGSHPFTFTLADDRDDDRPIFQHYLWSIPEHILEGLPEENRRQVQFSSVIVAFQPPWVLSTQDIKEFSKCRSFPPFIEPGHAVSFSFFKIPESFAKYELICSFRHRSILWDLCVRKNTPWFVLTSYNHWTFGMFSKGWTSAFVSGVYEYNHHHPTITECLTYWIASAMRLATTLRCPKVCEEPSNSETPCTVYDVMAEWPEAALALALLDQNSPD
ncbi:hypothetical protein F5880DRAFT_1626345 [Lentinula raphanica]|nr:hypothetical protein F5880DRAFT_1626345 [Lentinula raphanica]